MAEFYASFIYHGLDYTPSEPRPDGKGYQGKRIRTESAEEAAKVAKRDFVAEHAAHKALNVPFISPEGCHTIVIFEEVETGMRGIYQFKYDEVAA